MPKTKPDLLTIQLAHKGWAMMNVQNVERIELHADMEKAMVACEGFDVVGILLDYIFCYKQAVMNIKFEFEKLDSKCN